MYNGKRVNKRTVARAKRKTALLVSLILLFTMTMGATVAFLIDQTQEEKNVFTPASVPNEIVEDFKYTVKNDVKVKNNGNVSAFVRVAVVATWQKIQTDDDGEYVVDDDGNYVSSGEIAPVKPVLGVDFEWTMDPTEKWFKHGDYYYYPEAVPAGGTTTEYLFTGCKLKEGVTPPEGYTFAVEILSQTIQSDGVRESDGEHPVEIAWKVAYVDATGTIAAPAAD